MQEHIQQGRHHRLFPLESLESQGLAHAEGQHFVSPSELVKLTGPVRLRVGLVTSCAIQQPFASISLRPFQPQFILRPDPTIECGIQIFVVHVQLSWNVTLLPDRLSMVEGVPECSTMPGNARMWTSYLSWDPDILILSKLNSVGRGFSRTSTSYISESMTCA